MKILFKFSAQLKNEKFISNESFSPAYEDTDTYLVEKKNNEQSENVSYDESQNNKNQNRKDKIDAKITDFLKKNETALINLKDDERQSLFKITNNEGSSELIDLNQNGLDRKEFKNYLKSVDYQLTQIVESRTDIENKNDANTDYINNRDDIWETLKADEIIKIEQLISHTKDIKWHTDNPFKINNGELKIRRKGTNQVIYAFNNYDLSADSDQKKIDHFLENLKEQLNTNKIILENAANNQVLAAPKRIQEPAISITQKETQTIKTEKPSTIQVPMKQDLIINEPSIIIEDNEDVEDESTSIESLEKSDILDFVETFKNNDYKIPWREGNKFLADQLGIEETDENKLKAEIKKIQNDAGIARKAADGMAGIQTFATIFKLKPKNANADKDAVVLKLPDEFFTKNKSHIDYFNKLSIEVRREKITEKSNKKETDLTKKEANHDQSAGFPFFEENSSENIYPAPQDNNDDELINETEKAKEKNNIKKWITDLSNGGVFGREIDFDNPNWVHESFTGDIEVDVKGLDSKYDTKDTDKTYTPTSTLNNAAIIELFKEVGSNLDETEIAEREKRKIAEKVKINKFLDKIESEGKIIDFDNKNWIHESLAGEIQLDVTKIKGYAILDENYHQKTYIQDLDGSKKLVKLDNSTVIKLIKEAIESRKK